MLIQHIFLLTLVITVALSSKYPLVKTSLGTIRGHYKESYDKKVYSAFEGIPYAKPPVGDLRFSEPLEAESWKETLIANTTCACIQTNILETIKIYGTEDCLYLNVYVPTENPSPDDKFDVVVHIHGGAFMIGKGSLAGPRFLMDRNVIYVSMNYRLGPFGYLSTEDEVVPGNNGQKDQVLALKWIQKHIKQFGGNPGSVTLTGVSAGGSAVHFHYFSKLSKSLFHRGISHSGTALAPWAIQENALGNAKQLAATVGCVSNSNKKLLDCLKKKPAEEINNNIKLLKFNSGIMPLSLFAPVIEIPSESAFLDDHPLNILKREKFHDLPWISSIAEEEGSIAILILHDCMETLDENWNDIAHEVLDYTYTACNADKSLISQKIKEKYFESKKMNMDNFETILKLFGDRYFDHSYQKSAQAQAKVSKSNVFAYINAYKNNFVEMSRKSITPKFASIDYKTGHGEDSGLTYSANLHPIADQIRLDETDNLMKNLLLDMIISFIKTNKPKLGDIALQPLNNSEDFVHIFIDNPDNIEIRNVKELTPTEFWDSLPLFENEKYSKVICDDINLSSSSKSEL